MSVVEPSHPSRERHLRRSIWIAVVATVLLTTLIALFDIYVSMPLAQ